MKRLGNLTLMLCLLSIKVIFLKLKKEAENLEKENKLLQMQLESQEQ